MVVSKLYKIKRSNYQGNTGPAAGIIVKGAGADVQILGSNTLPAAQANMVDIAGEQLTPAGSFTFAILPEYIYFVGTADSIELIGYEEVDELGVLA